MQNKYIKFLLIALIIAFVVPQITLAAWYNPFSWHIWGNFWNYFFHRQTPATQQAPLTPGTLRNVTITYPNPYDTSKNDTFTLGGGHTLIHDAGNIMPRAYDVAATAVGDLDGDGVAEGVVGIYQGYGANIIIPIVFVFSDKNGVLTQIDSVLPDASIWNSETQIKSLSIDNGVLSVNLLVLAEKDRPLPHYQQQATMQKTVQYKLTNGKLVLQPTDQTAGWKTYTSTKYGYEISFQYPQDWKLAEYSYAIVLDKNSIPTESDFNGVRDESAPGMLTFYPDYATSYAPKAEINSEKVYIGQNNSIPAIKTSSPGLNVSPFWSTRGLTSYLIAQGPNQNQILINYVHLISDTQYDQIVNQILSTFKFTTLTQTKKKDFTYFLFPIAGSIFRPGEHLYIRWNNNADIPDVKIEIVAKKLSACPGGEYTNNGSMGTCRGYQIYNGKNTDFFDWLVPSEYPGAGYYLVRITPVVNSSVSIEKYNPDVYSDYFEISQ